MLGRELQHLFTILPEKDVWSTLVFLPSASNKACLSHLNSHQKVFNIFYFTTVTQHTPFIITHPTPFFVLKEAC